ncbi:hypothetical protein STSV2_56 [Sulfolobus virus STSV2]|uniref:hypothetical protein n=1 Tax=Sulfolobus virus STSV2 TaxID=1123964 RepID=UPI0002A82CB5|nr:hypothetical protein STSV2_56 [Sulfolobus virus STSV2]AFU92035.1 hypothetical protein STSV2_56 [Sulfolobus virus STSV2]
MYNEVLLRFVEDLGDALDMYDISARKIAPHIGPFVLNELKRTIREYLNTTDIINYVDLRQLNEAKNAKALLMAFIQVLDVGLAKSYQFAGFGYQTTLARTQAIMTIIKNIVLEVSKDLGLPEIEEKLNALEKIQLQSGNATS